MKVSDFFVGRLYQWGVRRIYGYPGDGINGVLGALQRAKHAIDAVARIAVDSAHAPLVKTADEKIADFHNCSG